MGKLPVLTAREIIRILGKLGFEQKTLGATSHRRFVHADGRRTTVPMHSGQDVGRGLLRKILRDIQLEPPEFEKLRQE